MTQPSVTAARLLFQQCVAASSQEGSSLEFIRNEISGYLLEKVEPVKLHQNVWKKTLDSISSSKKVRKEMILDPFYNNLPLVLQEFLSNKKVKWKNFSDVKIAKLTPSSETDKLELIHVMPGGSIPQHTHEGIENFLVLHGSYSDEYGTYTEGSLQTRDEDHDHKPIGHPLTGCIGLAYTDGKIKFSGKFSKILNFFTN
jgi:predicted ChrR family anti-sigma factor|tara:strand:+ start:9068 stop:9664 length:597 start_codon:yes stop_codon:yes gene_type:complete